MAAQFSQKIQGKLNKIDLVNSPVSKSLNEMSKEMTAFTGITKLLYYK
jgi:hypothetical protein